MSLILDALKRAERERRGETGAAPVPVPAPTDATPARRRARVPALAVVVGGLALSGLLLWDAFRPPAPEAPAAPPPAPPAQSQPAAPAPVVMARPAPAPVTVVPGTEGVASLDDLTSETVSEGAAPPVAPAPAKPGKAAEKPAPPAPAANPPEAPAQDSPTIATTPAPPPAAPPPTEVRPEAAPAQTPAAAVPPALTQPAPLRRFREMPPDYRADFPALRIEVHVYEKDPQRRFAMINGRRYRDGERLAEGPTLVEIVPEGMVLEYRGEKVLYTLGR